MLGGYNSRKKILREGKNEEGLILSTYQSPQALAWKNGGHGEFSGTEIRFLFLMEQGKSTFLASGERTLRPWNKVSPHNGNGIDS
jgi:hypothetical protein